MARYIGPVCRICRRNGEKLFLKGERCVSAKCAVEKRSVRAGKRSGKTQKVSEWGLQLREKQKARYTYGVLERQFSNYFVKAKRSDGVTGDNLFKLLERRLDNIVYRLGFVESRAKARQVVCHGHITVNGKKVDIPSYLVKAGDEIAWKEASTKTELYKLSAEEIESKSIPDWLDVDKQHLIGKVLSIPAFDQIGTNINENAIVEYYSR